MAIIYYGVSESVPVMLALFSLVLISALQPCGQFSLLSNPVMRFLSSISMEIYLSHMVIFRVIEKLGLTRLFASSGLSYIVTTLGTLMGTVIFSITMRWLIKKTIKSMKRRKAASYQRK